MHRRSFLLGLLVGCVVTAMVAQAARSIGAYAQSAENPKRLMLVSPAVAHRDQDAAKRKLPPGSIKKYFDGVPYYIVPLGLASR